MLASGFRIWVFRLFDTVVDTQAIIAALCATIGHAGLNDPSRGGPCLANHCRLSQVGGTERQKLLFVASLRSTLGL